MNGQSIKFLAGVCDLARLDIEAAAVTLRSEPSGSISALYAGMYARGSRAATGDGAEFSISVNANQFKTLALMFNDEDNARLERGKTGLRIRSKSSDALLREWGEEAEDDLRERKEYDLMAGLPADSLQSEVEAAAGFTSDSHLRPAFTGILFDFNGKMSLIASDGNSAFYTSETTAKTSGKGSFIVPTEDFLLGSRLVTGGNARVYKPKGQDAVVIYNNRAVFRSTLIIAPWPDTQKIMKERPSTHFKIEAAQLRNLVSAVKSLDHPGNDPFIEVSSAKGRVFFKTSSHAGSFSTSVKGTITETLHYMPESMAKVIKLGPVLDFYVPEKAYEPTIVECGQRRCWILTRI